MELAQIIKWVDDINREYHNSYFDRLIMQSKEENVRREYTPAYKEYSYAIISHIISQPNCDNKKALVRRLFRNGRSFFEYCKQQRDKHDWWIGEISMIESLCTYSYEDMYISDSTWRHWVAGNELLNFYSEVILTSVECGLTPTELCTDSVKDVITDIIDYARLTPQQKKDVDSTLLEMFILKDRDKVLKAIDAELESIVKQSGKHIALIICALEHYGYIANISGKQMKIISAFSLRYPNKVATAQAVGQYINAHRNPQAKTDKPPFTEKELKEFINKI